MEFVIFFFISWLVISLYGVSTKILNIIESTFIFLFILIVSINFSWIVIDELNLITVTEKGLPYSAFLLNRSIIIPFIILIHLNFLVKSKKTFQKIILLFTSVIILVSFNVLSINLNVIEYNGWSLWYDSVYFLCLGLLSILAYQLFNKISKGVVRN